MILRDPVHGIVSFDGAEERVVASLLRTREVQRLRHVRQLGLTSLVFPGAEHSRFSHAMGAAHVMSRLLSGIRGAPDVPQEQRLTASDTVCALAAALLHDLGHGPFSHLFEELLPNTWDHERWTGEILQDPATQVCCALERLEGGLAARVAALLAGQSRLRYLSQSVSGMLDVDRCDYLLRDSHMTGVRYGLFDLDWLLAALRVAQAPNGEWVLAVEGRKGLPPIEQYFLGRHFMYRQVYHHKATRAAECLMRVLFRRVIERVREGAPPAATPRAIVASARGEAYSLGDYLELDDARLLTCFAEWEQGDDPILADLSRRVRERDLFKTLPIRGGPHLHEELLQKAREVALRRGLHPDYSVVLDHTSDVPYWEGVDGSGGLWVAIRDRPAVRLGDVSFLLRELRNKPVRQTRLLFLPELRSEVAALVEDAVQ